MSQLAHYWFAEPQGNYQRCQQIPQVLLRLSELPSLPSRCSGLTIPTENALRHVCWKRALLRRRPRRVPGRVRQRVPRRESPRANVCVSRWWLTRVCSRRRSRLWPRKHAVGDRRLGPIRTSAGAPTTPTRQLGTNFTISHDEHDFCGAGSGLIWVCLIARYVYQPHLHDTTVSIPLHDASLPINQLHITT